MKNGKIEILRFLFSVLIVLFHSYATGKKGILNDGVGWIAVEFFFMLSGYFMVSSAIKRKDDPESLANKTLKFIIKKMRAVMPEFALAWIIALIVFIISRDIVEFHRIISLICYSIWELLFLSMTGLSYIRVNGVDWYISAMILSMVVLYPLTIKYGEMYYKIFAWVISFMILGFLYCQHDGFGNVYDTIGPFYKGVYRAIADISLGATLYPVVNKFNSIKLSDKKVKLLNIIEPLLWMLLFFLIVMTKHIKDTPVLILLIWILLVPTLSHYKENKLFNNKIVYTLGKYSLSLYLSHVYWARFIKQKLNYLSWNKTMVLYLGLVLITSLCIYILSSLLKKLKLKNEKCED